ncbi:MFS transporter [Ralstonia mannitolilytica]|uniref:Inner membrane transport protein ynfM n=1 Tax=Ralstonia mannitolilytica TaxID=105219 RepID=A0AAJ5D7E5_9RALS|nr:MFS transporter [Ralstonia mannitolilytica]CAG2148423.1 sugar efflux transporter [Ralstonia mannitolilytica]CAJ0727752.1 sugar efflux transporter [Ralstonia mannitolilytica]SUD89063.1 Inner membrane transport protein ynfM [Ralstonia mannitolilytica]SUD95023.1 Inner membrane transport protein ynfM [Ralstonia mannitolilytica]SUE42378.1 Inner membrane transport protein ynfM [Ralstonia mannitolilytica]
MTTEAPAVPNTPLADALPRGATPLFAAAVGLIVVNLFGIQPLVAEIAASIGWTTAATGLLVTATLVGYGIGLLLLMPLTDLQDNRALVSRTLWGAVASLALTAVARSGQVLMLAAFAIGVTSTVIQMLIALAGRLAGDHRRGRVLGDIMIGLNLGILLSRPAASLIAAQWGWRAYYGASAVAIVALAVVLPRVMPTFVPPRALSYGALLRSYGCLLRAEPVLRRRAATQALLMAAFTLFWTAVALRLAAAPFHLSQSGIGVFALCGAAGVVAAPVAGRLADRGLVRVGTLLAHGIAAAGLLLALASALVPGLGVPVALTMLAAAALLLDFGAIGDQALGRYTVNTLPPEIRGRVNGLYTGAFFFGAAAGGGLAGATWDRVGWVGVSVLALGFVAAAALAFLWPESARRAAHATHRGC